MGIDNADGGRQGGANFANPELPDMTESLAPVHTRTVLQKLKAPLSKAVAHAAGTEVDEQQAAVARLVNVATQYQTAVDFFDYAANTGESLYLDQAAAYAGQVAASVGALVRDHGRAHGLESSDAPDAKVQEFAQNAASDERIQAIGREYATTFLSKLLSDRADEMCASLPMKW